MMRTSPRSKLASINREIAERVQLINQFLQQGDFKTAAIYEKGKDTLGEKFIKHWSAIIQEEKTSLIVISIGSAGSEMQQEPPFAIHSLKKTAILNIDPSFVIPVKVSHSDAKQVSIDFLPMSIQLERFPKTYEALNILIKSKLAEDQQVVFIFHNSPMELLKFKNIIDANNNALGENFVVISSYHDEQPVYVYNKSVVALLEEKNFNQIKSGLTVLFGDQEPKTKYQINIILRENKLLTKYGMSYKQLSALTIDDLFSPPEQEKKCIIS